MIGKTPACNDNLAPASDMKKTCSLAVFTPGRDVRQLHISSPLLNSCRSFLKKD